MKGVEIWDVDQNFWKCNPHFKIPKAFNKLYTEDNSKDKKVSSQIMWALALYTDFGSYFKDLTPEERDKLIKDDYKVDITKYKDLVKAWEVFKSPIQKQMEQWSKFIIEKNTMMDTIKMDLDNWEDIEKMLLSNEKLYKSYEILQSRLAEESNSGVVKGDQSESLSEKGMI